MWQSFHIEWFCRASRKLNGKSLLYALDLSHPNSHSSKIVPMFCCLLIFCICHDNALSEEPKADNEQIAVAGGKIHRAGEILGGTIYTQNGEVAGKTKDLLFDLEEGRLALLVISAGNTENGESLAIPANLVGDLFSDHVVLQITKAEAGSTTLPKDPRELTRKWAATVFEKSNLQPYWRIVKDKVSESDEFVSLRQLQKTNVHNAKGTALGHIRDVAITPKMSVAYVGLARDDTADQLEPVPLSAFVLRSGSEGLILDLPKDILEHTPTFSSKEWPKALDRGWIEYVNVRYGRPVVGGVVHELKR